MPSDLLPAGELGHQSIHFYQSIRYFRLEVDLKICVVLPPQYLKLIQPERKTFSSTSHGCLIVFCRNLSNHGQLNTSYGRLLLVQCANGLKLLCGFSASPFGCKKKPSNNYARAGISWFTSLLRR